MMGLPIVWSIGSLLSTTLSSDGAILCASSLSTNSDVVGCVNLVIGSLWGLDWLRGWFWLCNLQTSQVFLLQESLWVPSTWSEGLEEVVVLHIKFWQYQTHLKAQYHRYHTGVSHKRSQIDAKPCPRAPHWYGVILFSALSGTNTGHLNVWCTLSFGSLLIAMKVQ